MRKLIIETGDKKMYYHRSLNTLGSLQVARTYKDGVESWCAWYTFQPGRVGHGSTRSEAVANIPKRK